jgi:GxxExxY protein
MGLDLRSKPEKAEERRLARGPFLVENVLTERIIGAAIEVHRHLGPGLLESAYEECLCYELRQLGLRFKRQAHLPIQYKGITLEAAYRTDLVVEDSVVVEIKATVDTPAIHSAQLLTYLKAAGLQVGLLINFNVPVLKRGLKRIVNRYAGPALETRNSASSASESREGHNSRRSEDSTFGSSPRFPPRLRVSASRTPAPSVSAVK